VRIEQLEYIVEIDKTHSILKAAEQLYVSQPSISAAVTALEKELGIKLFTRTKNGTFATPEGERIIQLAKNILKNVNDIYGLESEHNILDLMVIPALNSGIISDILFEWKKLYPNDMAAITEYGVWDIYENFLEYVHHNNNRCFCLCSLDSNAAKVLKRRFAEEKINMQYLCSDQMVCYISYNNPKAQLENITVKECHKHPLIKFQYMDDTNALGKDYRTNTPYVNELDAFYDSDNAQYIVSTIDTLLQLIAMDLGIAVMPRMIGNKEYLVQDGLIKHLPIENVEDGVEYYLLYNGSQELTEKEKKFIACVKDVFARFDKKYNYSKNE